MLNVPKSFLWFAAIRFLCMIRAAKNPTSVMRKLLLTALFLRCVLSISAQTIPIDFTKNPDKPVAIENPATGKTLFFFYPERLISESFAKQGNPCKVYEIDSKNLGVLRTNADNTIHVSEDGGQKIRILCYFSRGEDYFLALENDRECRVYRFSGQDLSMTQVDSFRAIKGETILTGVAADTLGYILSSKKVKKEDDQITVWRIGAGGRLDKHVFKVPDNRTEMLSDLFGKPSRLLGVRYGIEEDPEPASIKSKVYAGQNRVQVTLDGADVGTVYSNSIAILRVLTLDLSNDSLKVKPYYYTDSLVRDANFEKRSSYIYDNRLFQLYMNNEQLLLRIRDLETGKPLFTKALLREEKVQDFANSPILVPGRGIIGEEKEYSSVRKFVRRFSKFNPFIQVRRNGDDYLFSLGGFEEINVPTGGGRFNPVTGTWNGGVGGFGGYSYERSFSFYSAVNVQTMTRSTVVFKKSLIAVYAQMLEDLKKPRDYALYHMGGHYYLGYYNTDEKSYLLKPIEGY